MNKNAWFGVIGSILAIVLVIGGVFVWQYRDQPKKNTVGGDTNGLATASETGCNANRVG